jgi:hypothetical protein
MMAAWFMWLDRRVVNCKARVSRSSVEAVGEWVLRMAEWREAVRSLRFGVQFWYS